MHGFLAGGRVSGAGERTYWMCGSGEWWEFNYFELQRDKVNCLYGGVK